MAERGLKARIVESDGEFRSLLIDTLIRQCSIVEVVETTTEGLERLAERSYDFVVANLHQTPSGLVVYRAATSKGIRAVIVGSAGDSALVEAAKREAGGNFLEKPFQMDELYKKLTD